MRWVTLDKIVRSALFQRGYPIHYYALFLKLGADGFRELSMDSLRLINTVKIPVTSYKAAPLPCDFLDYVKIGIAQAGYVQPLVYSEALNRLPNYDSQGNIIVYPDIFQSEATNGNVNGVGFLGYNWVTWNEYNEPTGRLYGLGTFPGPNGFKVLPERDIIQLDDNSVATNIILEYISDGQCCDSCSRITSYAQAAIEAYIFWKYKEFNRYYSNADRQLARQEFINQHRILRGRKDDMTIDTIQNIIRMASMAAYKS